jgi:DNA-binding MarR family transcriptional regulator
MRIEEELKTKAFGNENQKAQLNIMFTAGWVRCAISAALKAYGVTPEQYNVLRILRGSHPKAVCLKDITCRMVDRNSNTSRIVDKLADKGWVVREASATDRREVQIGLTDKGNDLLAKIDKQYGADKMMHPSGLSVTEAETLNHLLDKLRSV